jgi:hypothetical protein
MHTKYGVCLGNINVHGRRRLHTWVHANICSDVVELCWHRWKQRVDRVSGAIALFEIGLQSLSKCTRRASPGTNRQGIRSSKDSHIPHARFDRGGISTMFSCSFEEHHLLTQLKGGTRTSPTHDSPEETPDGALQCEW